MPSPADLVALTLAALAPAQDRPPEGPGPRASSNEGARFDKVGYAGVAELPGGVAVAGLPAGAYVEVTALDSGRTMLFTVAGDALPRAGEPVALSADAMRQLGLETPGAPVRVRAARPSPSEVAALRGGQPAGARPDAPPVLLVGLRKDLPPRATATIRPARARSATPKPKPPRAAPNRPIDPPERQLAVQTPAMTAPASGWGVQVAALSNEGRAKTLAGELGGRVRTGGGLFRVQLGPFADRAGAEAARANLARRGHAGAALVRIP